MSKLEMTEKALRRSARQWDEAFERDALSHETLWKLADEALEHRAGRTTALFKPTGSPSADDKLLK